jgi:hypothetical protein
MTEKLKFVTRIMIEEGIPVWTALEIAEIGFPDKMPDNEWNALMRYTGHPASVVEIETK